MRPHLAGCTCTLRLLFPPGSVGLGRPRCQVEAPLLLRGGRSITCRGIAAFVPDGRQLGAVEECDGGVLALRGVPALGPEGEFAFLEYVEKAKKGDSNGIERLALTSGVVFGVRQGVQTGPLLPVGS